MTVRRFLLLISFLAATSAGLAQLAISPASGYSQFLTAGSPVNLSLTVTFSNQPIGASWSAAGLPAGLFISTTSSGQGLISGTAAQAGSFPFTVTANAATAGAATVSYRFDIFGITTSSLPTGNVGIVYSQQFTSIGASTSVTWSVAGDKLPGLTLSTGGLLSGTPTAAGTFSILVTATDSGGTQTSRSYSLTILPNLTITPATIPNGTVNTAYPVTTLGATGTGSLTWSLAAGNSLPPGLFGLTTTPSPSAIISGTPTAAGAYKFTVQVKDGTGAQGSVGYTVVIAANTVPLSIATTSLPSATIGTVYSATLAATGGTPAYTWSISVGSLPSGLSLNTATGAIAGTPAANAATSSFTVQVVGSDFATTATKATANLSITVNAALSITTTALPAGTVGTPYAANTTLAATGGTPPYTWTQVSLPVVGVLPVNSGVGLPTGLSLATNGAITGTPTATNTWNFRVQVKDSASTPAIITADLSILINAATTPPAVTVTVTGATSAISGKQLPVTASAATATTLALNGALTLTFTSGVTNATDDPAIQFVQQNTVTGSRQVTFTIPAGQTQAVFTNGATVVATGTVAGTITLTTTSLSDSNGNAVTPPAPVTIVIGPTAPMITKVTAASGAGTLTVAVTGFSPTREIKSMAFHFVPTTGTTLAQADVTVDVSSQFATYYSGAASKAFGSQFTVTVPFTFAASGIPVVAVTADMTNSIGTSARSSPVNP